MDSWRYKKIPSRALLFGLDENHMRRLLYVHTVLLHVLRHTLHYTGSFLPLSYFIIIIIIIIIIITIIIIFGFPNRVSFTLIEGSP